MPRREDAGPETKEEEEPNKAEHEDKRGRLLEASWEANGGGVRTRQPLQVPGGDTWQALYCGWLPSPSAQENPCPLVCDHHPDPGGSPGASANEHTVIDAPGAQEHFEQCLSPPQPRVA
ncbi:hypothetical protein NDU88_000223 [Pleurodeles waltl]|uniref:Uncharacterized protein n=1 Tax=Pleurodeles waltl TaxID=8319 RepID=A0AAV7TGJ2_PLEWA|nr:hypothetical protein NDU88_000223 [Pleurodeles waltl]